jgi:hypothetical protein
MRINNDQLSSAVGILLGSLIVIHSLSYEIGSFDSPSTGFFPLLEGLAIVLLSLIGLIVGTLRGRKRSMSEPLFKTKHWERPLIILLSLFTYAFVVSYVGFTMTTIIFLSFIFRYVERIRLAVAVPTAAVIALASYFTFAVFLHAQLPKGVLGF